MATASAAAQPQARVPVANEDQGRPQSLEGQAAQRPLSSDGVTQIFAWPMAHRSWASVVMRKKYRLRANADFECIRREGSSWAHPLLVLSALPNSLGHSRFGFVAGRRIGRAVKRNQIKRRMREAVRTRAQKGEIAEGWDIVFIARRAIADASFQQVDQAIGLLLCRAGLSKVS
jgi:ribonuclease P protein component